MRKYSPEDRRSNSANIFLGNNCSSLLSRSNQSLPTSPTVLTEQMKSFTTPTEYSDSSNNSSYGTSSWNIVIQSSNCNKSMKSETNLLTSKNKQNPGSNETDHSCSPQISDQITAEEKNCFSRVLSSSQTIETFSSTKTSSFTQSPRSLTSSLSTISILPSSYDMNKKPAVCDVEKTEGIQRLHFPWSPSVSSFSHKLNKSFPENGGKFTSKLFKEWQNESTNTSSDDDDDNEEQCMDDTSLSLDSDEQLVHQTNALIREVSRCYSLSSINFTSSSSSSEEFASPKIVCIKKPVENEVYEFIHIPSNSLSSTKCLKYVGENAYMEEMENLMKSKSDYYPYSVCICARENKYGQKKFQSICETNQPSLWLLSYLYNNEYDIRYSDGKQPLPHYPNDQADNSDEIKYEFTYSSFPPVIVRCKKQEYRPSDSSLQKESDSLFNNTDTDNEISSQCLSPETTEISNRIFIGDKSVYEKLTVLDLEQYTASTAATTTTTTNKEIQKQLRTKLVPFC
ncbi:unnamed protein product [Trichobilharzia regenti]|nr:unnamed protein product [Trichobilharzia regenti]